MNSAETVVPDTGPQRFERKVAAGVQLFKTGEVADRCYLIREGKVRLSQQVRAMERTIRVLEPGDLFGEDALLTQASRSCDAVVVEEARLLELDRNTLATLVARQPDVAMRLIRQLVRRLRSAEERVVNSLLPDPASRVTHSLLREIDGKSPAPDSGYPLALSPQELSVRTGLSLDEVKQTMGTLVDQGYVNETDEGVLAVPQLEALKHLQQLLSLQQELEDGLL